MNVACLPFTAAMNLPVARCPLTLPSPPVGERVAEGRVRGLWFRGPMCELFRRILSPRETDKHSTSTWPGMLDDAGRFNNLKTTSNFKAGGGA